MEKVLCVVLAVMSLSASIFRTGLGNFYWVLLICVYICGNNFLVNELIRKSLNVSIKDVRKTLLNISPPYVLFAVVFLIIHSACLLFYSKTEEFILYIALNIVLFSHKLFYKFSHPEVKYISEINNVSLGYGAALCYYENYLKLTLPEYSFKKDFLTRVRIFESRQDIKVYHKLVILIPQSCKISTYIDNDVSIFRCKEMEPLEMNVSGIPNRKFNITVYNIRHRNRSVRLGLEYAQPLKALMAMKEKNLISGEELRNQREIFIRHLKQMLKDSRNSHELVELIEYDDEMDGFKLEDLLMDNKLIFEFSTSVTA